MLRAQKRSSGGTSGAFTADLVKHGGLHDHPLVKFAAQTISNVGSAHIELCRACGDVLSEVQSLTNEVSPQTKPLLLLVVQAVVEGGKQLLPASQAYLEKWLSSDSELATRLAVLGRLVGELGGAPLPNTNTIMILILILILIVIIINIMIIVMVMVVIIMIIIIIVNI